MGVSRVAERSRAYITYTWRHVGDCDDAEADGRAERISETGARLKLIACDCYVADQRSEISRRLWLCFEFAPTTPDKDGRRGVACCPALSRRESSGSCGSNAIDSVPAWFIPDLEPWEPGRERPRICIYRGAKYPLQ
jgi:hypothetical protein